MVFIDAINVKIRDGNVAKRPIYIALGVTVDGTRDVLGLWAGEHGDGEGSKYRLRVLSEIKNRHPGRVHRGVRRPEGPADRDRERGPVAITQTCVIHLLRNSFRYASKRDWAAIAKATSNGSTPRPASPQRWTRSSRSARPGATATRRSSSCGRTPGPSSLCVPGIRQGNPQRDLYDQQHRKLELEDPQGGERPRPLPIEQAAPGRVYLAIMSIDPTGKRPQALGQPMESTAQRLRTRLPRTTHHKPKLTVRQRVTPG